MNKKIKIIDIFNIISRGDYEALPLNIQVNGNKYNWDTLEHFYNKEDRDRDDLLELALIYDTVTFLDMNAEILDNTTVEDNTEEIEELIADDNGFIKTENGSWKGRKLDVAFANKIDEIIKVVNQIRKEKE